MTEGELVIRTTIDFSSVVSQSRFISNDNKMEKIITLWFLVGCSMTHHAYDLRYPSVFAMGS